MREIIVETTLPYTHLLYVRKYSIFTNKYELYIVGVNTKDIFHTMGEYLYRSETQVERIDQAKCTQEKLDFWAKEGYEIYEFKDKYNVAANAQSTADMQEVRHGHWETGYFHDRVCSCCTHPDNDLDDYPHHYCPNCGAKMDKDGD